MRDNRGKLLTDGYLADRLSGAHPWIKAVYSTTSGYIHLSQAHIFNTFTPPAADAPQRTVEIVIGKGDRFGTDEFYEEAAEAFIEATHTLFHYVVGWVKTKENPLRTGDKEH